MTRHTGEDTSQKAQLQIDGSLKTPYWEMLIKVNPNMWQIDLIWLFPFELIVFRKNVLYTWSLDSTH